MTKQYIKYISSGAMRNHLEDCKNEHCTVCPTFDQELALRQDYADLTPETAR